MPDVQPPTLSRFCKIKASPRKLEYYDRAYRERCIAYATEKLRRRSLKQAEQILNQSVRNKDELFGLAPEDRRTHIRGFVERNKAAAALELDALRAALRTKKLEHALPAEGRQPFVRTKRTSAQECSSDIKVTPPKLSFRETSLQQELQKSRHENTQLRKEIHQLREEAATTRSLHDELSSQVRALQFDLARLKTVDPLERTITRLLEEGREKTKQNATEWKKFKKALTFAFHPDKLQMLKSAHDLYTSLQNHTLFQATP